MKVALVHDYLNQYGGAERVLESFKEIFPDAPIYTLISDLSKMPDKFERYDIHNSFIQKIPFSKRNYKKMMSLFPLAIEQFDLSSYDVVLSSSSAFAKGVLTRPGQLHFCYCHTPMRYVWDLYHDYLKKSSSFLQKVLPPLLHSIRNWDQLSSQRVDHYIANSNNVRKRIEKYYNKKSHVIYPPVSFERFAISDETEDYFLIVSRLISYKRIDIVIQAFNQLQLPLVIIGDGYDRSRLEKLAGSTVKLIGIQSDEIVAQYYSKCRALIMAGEEDFGITPLEAQASGRPVIAYGKGGALETVVNKKTGIFFNEQTPESVLDAVQSLKDIEFDSQTIRDHAQKFNNERFKREIENYIFSITKQEG